MTHAQIAVIALVLIVVVGVVGKALYKRYTASKSGSIRGGKPGDKQHRR